MIPILLRYAGLALVAGVFGVSGGFLAIKNERPTPPSGTTVAIPAQPFPSQGIPAIPAVPAQPLKGKSDIGTPSISYILGAAGNNRIVNHNWGATIIGTNFDQIHNDIYWDGKLLIKDVGANDYSDYPPETQQIGFEYPLNLELGSYHNVYVKSSHGTSNTIQVQVVEYIVQWPEVRIFRPLKGPVGTKSDVIVSQVVGDQPISSQLYIVWEVPASAVKPGATGSTHIFLPMEKSTLSVGTVDPAYENKSYINGYWFGYDLYSFTVPKEATYCPSWLWDAKHCTLAQQDSKVAVPVGGPYLMQAMGVFKFKYREDYAGVVGNPSPLTQFTVTQ